MVILVGIYLYTYIGTYVGTCLRVGILSHTKYPSAGALAYLCNQNRKPFGLTTDNLQLTTDN
jgi:hypothetical protein